MLERKLSPCDDYLASMVINAAGKSGRVLQEDELEDLINTIIRSVDRRRKEQSQIEDQARRQAKAHDAAEAYLQTWINENTGRPAYCERIASGFKAGHMPEQRPGELGQGIWIRAYLEGWNRELEAWVIAEARRQQLKFPDSVIDVAEPTPDQIEELR